MSSGLRAAAGDRWQTGRRGRGGSSGGGGAERRDVSRGGSGRGGGEEGSVGDGVSEGATASSATLLTILPFCYSAILAPARFAIVPKLFQ